MKKPVIFNNPSFQKNLHKFKALYYKLRKLLEDRTFFTLHIREQNRLIYRFNLLYKRICKVQVQFGLKLAGLAMAFACVAQGVNAQSYQFVDHIKSPLYNGSNPIEFSNPYLAPSFVDYDNDGDYDAFIGRYDGRITLFKNRQVESGTDSVYFEEYDPYNPNNPFRTQDIGNNAAPSFVDIDSDGDRDAFIGTADSGIVYYKNMRIETATDSFQLQAAIDNPLSGITNEYEIAPYFVDIDGDSDLDLFFGEQYGQIRHYKNMREESGNDSTYFEQQSGVDNLFYGVDVGDNSGPAFVDIDDDLDFDCFIGNKYGSISFYKNMKTETGVDSVRAETNIYFNPISNPVSYYYRKLDFVDLDEDGDFEAFTGDDRISYYMNIGTAALGRFIELPVNNLKFNSSPELADMDNDSDLDMITGRGNAYFGGNELRYFNNIGATGLTAWDDQFILQPGTDNPFYGFTPYEPIPAAVDLDHDTDMDVFVGTKYGTIYYYKNLLAEEDSLYFEEVTGDDNPFNTIDPGNRANMDFVDLDDDGDMDAFIGNGYGFNDIFYYRNMDIEDAKDSIYFVQQPNEDNPLYAFIGPNDPSLEFIDYDGDGDFDVFMGGNIAYGAVNYYKNIQVEEGSDTAHFIFQSGSDNPLNGVNIGNRSQLAFMDADNDSDYDLITGNSNGVLNFYACNQKPQQNGNIPDMNAVVFRNFTYEIPENMFVNTDINPLDSLSFVAVDTATGGLPAWLIFEASQPRTFEGTPTAGYMGSIATIAVIVSDKYGQNASDTFQLSVINEAPELIIQAPDQYVEPLVEFNFQLPDGMFTDEGDTLSYSTRAEGYDILPPWMSFNDTTLTYQGTPPASDTLSIYVTARDIFEKSTTDTFNLFILPNNPPVLSNNIPNRSTPVNESFTYTFPANTFTDDSWDSLAYTATRSNDSPLPSWLSFNPGLRRFSGTPTAVQTINVKVTATDLFGTFETDVFQIEVYETVGVDDPIADVVNIYPNPSDGMLSVKLEGLSTSELEIELVSASGQVLLADKLAVHGKIDKQYDLTNLGSGYYIMRISTKEGKTLTREIVIH